jgi:hypothetical protein
VSGSLNPFVTEISIWEDRFSCPCTNYSDLFFLFGDGQVAWNKLINNLVIVFLWTRVHIHSKVCYFESTRWRCLREGWKQLMSIRCMTTLWTFHGHILDEAFTNWIPQVCSTLYQSLWYLSVLMDSALLYWCLWLNLQLLLKYALFIPRFHWVVFLFLCV